MRRSFFISAAFLAACGASTGGETSTPTPSAGAAQTGSATAAEVQSYTCSMHPHYISTDPDAICPICGMDLVPADTSANPMGDGSVAVAPEIIQTLGVRTARAAFTDFSQSLRAYGTVEADDSLQAVETSRLEGWISGLTARAEGDAVLRGQRLYRIYSPQLVGAQKDLLNSLRIGNPRRIDAVRQRLVSLGMQSGTIDRVTETRDLIEQVPIYAEHKGTVAEIMVADGDYVKPGTPILRLQDFGDVWVVARIPEGDLPLIREGMITQLKFPSAPAADGPGTIEFIYPTIDTVTRTAQLRISLPNPEGTLRPGAYADIDFDLRRDKMLSVPTEAILRDSGGEHVVVAMGDGRFAARPVQTGEVTRDRTAILAGLRAGEEVVVSGQFLLGSEANLREGFAKLSSQPVLGLDTPLSELPIDADTLDQINHLVDQALYYHEALTDGYDIDPFFVDPALALVPILRGRFGATQLDAVLSSAQTAMQAAKASSNASELRRALAALMDALRPWLLDGAPSNYAMHGLVLFQDSATESLWLQEALPARNPYGPGPEAVIPWPDPMADMHGSHPAGQDEPGSRPGDKP
ncbi:MAG: efflux RND transporter periplasmic adaptor subunit [Pseudomonadota bacterium]